MPGGQYLRTNWRSTHTIAGIAGLGGAIPKASCQSGAGGQPPNGGLIWIQSIGGLGNATTGGGAFSLLTGWCDSTLGLMSLFYGGGVYGSGYLIQPLHIQPLTFSSLFSTECLGVQSIRTGHVSGSAASQYIVYTGSMLISANLSNGTNIGGSYVFFTPYCGSASGMIAVSTSQICNFQFLGVVVSSP